MNLTTECKHGVKVSVEGAPTVPLDYLTLFVRALLIACPACRYDAEGYLPEPSA